MNELSLALAIVAVTWALVALDLGRRFLTWAAAREQRVDADGQAAALAELGRRVGRIEDERRQERAVGLGRR